MDTLQPTPTKDPRVRRAQFILWFGLSTIIIIGVVIAVYFIFVKEATAPVIGQ